MSNISKEGANVVQLNDNKGYMKRLKSARKEITEFVIFQDINQSDLFASQSSKDKTLFWIENLHLDPNDPINGVLSCGCPDQKYRGVECKHVLKIKMKLLAKTPFKQIDIRKELSDQAQTEFIVLENWEISSK